MKNDEKKGGRGENAGGRVLIVEDDAALGDLLREEIEDAGLPVRRVPSAEVGWTALAEWRPDLVVCDLRLPGMDGLDFLKLVQEKIPEAPPGFLMVTAFGTIPKAVECLKAGAEDFLTKPLDLEHFMLSVRRILERVRLREMVLQMKGLLASDDFHGIAGQSPAMRRLFEQIRKVAQARGPVLVLGESGSGKELVARAIHNESNRSDGPFIPVNCAGIPENLVESEFFGHAEGAFTGARKNREGLFAEAEGGTLLLDEISEMPLFLQAKLLRILQDGKVRRVGENRESEVDVRILGATHRDLEDEVRAGRFREDLFFRLETFTLRVPPLRERGEDVELLAARFLRRFSLVQEKPTREFTDDALARIAAYPFPGNVRELRNAMERAATFATGRRVAAKHLPARIREHSAESRGTPPEPGGVPDGDDHALLPLAEIERRHIRNVLDRVGGNKRRAAAILGIGRGTLYRKLGETEE